MNDEVTKKLAAIAAAYKPHLFTATQDMSQLQSLKGMANLPGSDGLATVVSMMRDLAAAGHLADIPALLREIGQHDQSMQSDAVGRLPMLLCTSYFLGHLELSKVAFEDCWGEHSDWKTHIEACALDDVRLASIAGTIENAVRERMARS